MEALRDSDTPPQDPEAELVPELRNKRLGLSDTVYAQIRRYKDSAGRGQRIGLDETVGIARLVGRRSDAEAVFRLAGRKLARAAYDELPHLRRRIIRSLPGLLTRPLAIKSVRKASARYFEGNAQGTGAFVHLTIPQSVTLTEWRAGGCTYYEAALAELLTLLGVGGSMAEHVRCVGRGDTVCEWRADLRIGSKSAS
jgi:predicted hydrocarbon binding protein